MSAAGDYWLHANQSDSMTSNNFATPGAANYWDGNYARNENGLPTYLTDVGAYGANSQNYYGLNDMGGNVREWNDLTGLSSAWRGLRGGSWDEVEAGLRSSFRGEFDTSGGSIVGFRLASSIPEPSSTLLTLLCGTGLLCRRRRSH